MTKRWVVLLAGPVGAVALAAQAPDRQALVARAKTLELNTPYVPPPGEALVHDASGFAKIMTTRSVSVSVPNGVTHSIAHILRMSSGLRIRSSTGS